MRYAIFASISLFVIFQLGDALDDLLGRPHPAHEGIRIAIALAIIWSVPVILRYGQR